MIQRQTRPGFSKEDEERLLAYMDVTRHLSINYGAAYGFRSPQYALKTSLNEAIDKLAEQITGDPQFFWLSGHTSGGQSSNEEGVRARQERELHWRELRRKY
jgi:hypothetical protein